MDTILNSHSESQSSEHYRSQMGDNNEKSELMQLFERNVHDMYWAYRDLLREIFESDEGATAWAYFYFIWISLRVCRPRKAGKLNITISECGAKI